MKRKMLGLMKLVISLTGIAQTVPVSSEESLQETERKLVHNSYISGFKSKTLLLNQSPYLKKREMNSYLGGLPKLTDDIAWPRSKSGTAMLLVATIDLSEVHSASSGLLNKISSSVPEEGFLLFFVDNESEELWEGEEGFAQVLHLKRLSNKFRSPPSDVVSVFSDVGIYDSKLDLYDIGDYLKDGRYPTYFPEVPFGFELLESKPYDHDSKEYYLSSQITLPDGKRPRSSRDWIPNNQAINYEAFGITTRRYQSTQLIDIKADYPLNWLAVDITCQMIVKDLVEYHKGRLNLGYYKEFSRSELDKLIKYEKDVYSWLEKSKEYKFTDLLAGSESENFIQFIKTIYLEPGNELIKSRYQKALDTALSLSWGYLPESVRQKRVSEKVRDYFDLSRTPFNWGGGMRHQMFGYATDVQDLGNLSDNYILLLQISTDKALNMMVGDVGAMQYWIAPADLEKMDFSKVIFTIAGH